MPKPLGRRAQEKIEQQPLINHRISDYIVICFNVSVTQSLFICICSILPGFKHDLSVPALSPATFFKPIDHYDEPPNQLPDEERHLHQGAGRVTPTLTKVKISFSTTVGNFSRCRSIPKALLSFSSNGQKNRRVPSSQQNQH